MITALIIVDVQNDFIEGGSLAVDDGEQTAARIANILVPNKYGDQRDYDYIVTTQDWHVNPGDHWSETPDYVDTWPVHAKAGTHGAELSPTLDPILSKVDANFRKGMHAAAYSGFEGLQDRDGGDEGSPSLAQWLDAHNVTDVDVVGIATDYCVKATAIDAAKLGYKTRVLIPYTAAVDGGGGGLPQARREMREAGVILEPDFQPEWDYEGIH